MDTFHITLGFGTLIVLIAYFTIHYFPDGGFVQAVQMMQENGTYDRLSTPGPNGAFDWKGMLGNALTGAIATVVWPHIFMRTYVAASKENFKYMAWTMPMAYVVIYSLIVFIGIIIAPAILGPNFADSENLVSILYTQYAPPLIAFISLLCLFAFGVSTADSLLLSASAMASRDIYLHHFYENKNKAADPKQIVKFGRLVLLILMILSIIVVAIKPALIVDYAYKLSSPFFAQILPCTIAGLFWKRATREGAYVGTMAGLIVAIYYTFFAQPPLGFSALIWSLIVNGGLLIVISLFTKVPEDVVAKYHKRIDSIIYSGAELSSINEKTLAAVAK